MMHTTAKFGRFKFLTAESATEALFLQESTDYEIKEIHRLTPFLEKISARFLFFIDRQKEIQFDEKAINRLLQASFILIFMKKKTSLLPPVHLLITRQAVSATILILAIFSFFL